MTSKLLDPEVEDRGVEIELSFEDILEYLLT
jgi:hypothetical protein